MVMNQRMRGCRDARDALSTWVRLRWLAKASQLAMVAMLLPKVGVMRVCKTDDGAFQVV